MRRQETAPAAPAAENNEPKREKPSEPKTGAGFVSARPARPMNDEEGTEAPAKIDFEKLRQKIKDTAAAGASRTVAPAMKKMTEPPLRKEPAAQSPQSEKAIETEAAPQPIDTNEATNKPSAAAEEAEKPALEPADGGVPDISDTDEEKNDREAFVAPIRPRSIGVPLPPRPPAAAAPIFDDIEEEGKEELALEPEPPKEDKKKVRKVRIGRFIFLLLVAGGLAAAVIYGVAFLLNARKNMSGTAETPQDGAAVTDGTGALTGGGAESDAAMADTDGDGITDQDEIALGTDLTTADTDGDGFSDKEELDGGYDPLTAGGKLDTDRDGLPDPDERCWQTDLSDPDTDGDGWLDGQETLNGYDPLVPSPNDKLNGPGRCSS